MLAFVYEHSFQLFYHLKYHGVEKQTFDLNRIFSMEWEYFRAVSFVAFDKCVSCENGIVFSPVNSRSFEGPYKCFKYLQISSVMFVHNQQEEACETVYRLFIKNVRKCVISMNSWDIGWVPTIYLNGCRARDGCRTQARLGQIYSADPNSITE